MFANTYDTLVEPWKACLLKRHARRMGFRGADLDDAQQEIILDVIAFRFDASRSQGASESTALSALILRRLCTLRRTRRRYQQRVEPLAELPEPYEEAGSSLLLREDVRDFLGRLDPTERVVCEGLADGKSVCQIARRRGCSWHTVKRQVKIIRQQLEALGLNDWLQQRS